MAPTISGTLAPAGSGEGLEIGKGCTSQCKPSRPECQRLAPGTPKTLPAGSRRVDGNLSSSPAYVEGMEVLLQDLRFAARMLGRGKGVAVAAVLCIGLGIGINASAMPPSPWSTRAS